MDKHVLVSQLSKAVVIRIITEKKSHHGFLAKKKARTGRALFE